MNEKEIIQTLRNDAVEIIQAIPESGKLNLQVQFFNAVFPELIINVCIPKGENTDEWIYETRYLDLSTEGGRKNYDQNKEEVFATIARFAKMVEE